MRMRLPGPVKISRPEDEPPYVYRTQGRGREWTITVGSLHVDTPAPEEEDVVDVRTSACPTCGAISSALGYLSISEGLSRRRKHRGWSANYGIARHQERVIPDPGQLIVRGYPPKECPGCGSRLRFDLVSLDHEKAIEMCKEGGIVDIEALPWEV